MSNKIVIPYFTDETATAWGTTIGDYVDGQSCITKGQLVMLASELDVNVSENSTIDEVLEDAGMLFDRIAIVDEQHADLLAKIAHHAIADHGNDSDWYEACENYNEVLVELADFTLPI